MEFGVACSRFSGTAVDMAVVCELNAGFAARAGIALGAEAATSDIFSRP